MLSLWPTKIHGSGGTMVGVRLSRCDSHMPFMGSTDGGQRAGAPGAGDRSVEQSWHSSNEIVYSPHSLFYF